MKFVVYGVEVVSPIMLPLPITSKGVYDQVLRLQVDPISKQKKVFEFETPVAEIHGRKTQLFTNMSFSLSRMMTDRYWKLNIEGLFSFMWGNTSDTMAIEYENELNIDKLTFWLLHTVVPIYLMLKQSSLLLHASVTEVDNHALLFIAPSYGGKSTLVDFFVKQGHQLFSDDKVRLKRQGGNYSVYPSYPYRRPYRKLETLGDHTENFPSQIASFEYIYFLNFVAPEDDCCIDEIKGLKKFEVLRNAYLYEPVSMSKIEMEYLIHLVKNVNLCQVNIPKDLIHLPEVYDMIMGYTRRDQELCCENKTD